MSNIRVLIADDSALFCQFLKNAVNKMEGFTVCGFASNAYEARDYIEKYQPDMLILDIEMPKMNGLNFLRQLIPQYTIPIIVCSAMRDKAIQALQSGATDFILKPDKSGYDLFKNALEKSLNNALKVKRVKCGCDFYIMRSYQNIEPVEHKIVAIGGSTGGTEALERIIKNLKTNCPPVVAVLHMPKGYTTLYAERLNNTSKITVMEATNGLYVHKGMAVIAEGESHMRVFKDNKGYFVTSSKGPKVSGHCPSVDVLFESVAYSAGKNAMGVILTGMGSDGANGLSKMHKSGAYTIGQNKESCVVYGMPKVAYELGAVKKQCDLDTIAYEINRLGG